MLGGAVRRARMESSGPRRVKKRRSRPRPRVELPQGAKLVRTWRGRKHEVTVLEEGKRFSYQGETYESLSEIAEKITSAHWSGPVSRGDLLGDLAQALVGLALVAEALPLLEDRDLVLSAPPGADELRALGKLDSRARPRASLFHSPRS